MNPNLRDLAIEEATLKALADRIKDRMTEVRAELQAGLDVAERETGVRQLSALLPDGTPVATVALTEPKPEARVIDPDAFKAWVLREFPGEIERRFVTEVRDAFAAKVLAEVQAAGVSRVVDPETGEIRDVAGVEIRATRSRTHSLRFRSTGRDDIAAAWQRGQLTSVVLPQIAAGGAE